MLLAHLVRYRDVVTLHGEAEDAAAVAHSNGRRCRVTRTMTIGVSAFV
jgi:hypothetical protein